MSFLRRNQEKEIHRLLEVFPVVLILGVRQCGKSTIAKMVRPEWKYFDLENTRDYDYITSDIGFFLKENSRQVIIDEAQELPELFRNLRGVIDSDRKSNNRYILTGSSSPELISHVSDSLAGRVGIVELGTLKMNEIQEAPLSPFYRLFNEEISSESMTHLKSIEPVDPELDVISLLLTGGYPDVVTNRNPLFRDDWMENYFQTYINRDIRKLFPKLDSLKYRRFINMLSELSGTIINKAQVGRSLDISEVTIRDYLDIAHNTYFWRMIPSYEKTRIKSVTKMPKGILRDSGLLHYLSSIDTREKMLRSPLFGHSFESFVIEEIIKGLQAAGIHRWDYYYYRTKNGIEVDLLLEGRFGLLPIEIKSGISTSLKDLNSLAYFVDSQKLPLGLVINNSNDIRQLSEKIIQIPAAVL